MNNLSYLFPLWVADYLMQFFYIYILPHMLCKKVVLPILELLVCLVLDRLIYILSLSLENELNNRRIIKKSVDVSPDAVVLLGDSCWVLGVR